MAEVRSTRMFGLSPLSGLVPLALWALLLASLVAGDVRWIYTHTTRLGLEQGIHATFPLFAAFLAICVITYKALRRRPRGFGFVGPLGLAAAYGVVGMVSLLKSPDEVFALQWTLKYLAVPLVLWAIVWGTDPLGKLRRLVTFNWLTVVLLVSTLFAVAWLYLGLDQVILDPSRWLDCRLEGQWYVVTDHVIRPTGVGRFAAIGGVISLGGLWYGKWRLIWTVLLLVSLMLLLTSGARTAMAGFALAAILVTFLYGGKKAVAWGLFAFLLLAPLAWATGVHSQFLNKCVFRAGFTAGQSLLPADQQPSIQPARADAPVASVGGGAAPGSLSLNLPSSSEGPLPARDLPASEGASEATGAEVSPPVTAYNGAPAQAQPPTAPVGFQSPEPKGSPGGSPPLERTDDAPLPLSAGTPGGSAPLERTDDTPLPSSTGSPSVAEKAAEPQRSATATPGSVSAKSENTPRSAQKSRSGRIPAGFFTLTGRTVVWDEGWRLFKESPWLGYGFEGDRLVLGTHTHNTLLHALIQSGLIGTVPLVLALILAWYLLLKSLSQLSRFSGADKHLLILTAGITVSLTVRSVTESTGAFFSVDWLLVAPLLLYVQLVRSSLDKKQVAT